MQEVSLDGPISADQALLWRDDSLYLLDQRRLPRDEVFIVCHDAQATADAIRAMVVRGAPAIGIAAAYGVALAARHRYARDPQGWRGALEGDLQLLAAARPTAVNLKWAIERLHAVIRGLGAGDPAPRVLGRRRRIVTAPKWGHEAGIKLI